MRFEPEKLLSTDPAFMLDFGYADRWKRHAKILIVNKTSNPHVTRQLPHVVRVIHDDNR